MIALIHQLPEEILDLLGLGILIRGGQPTGVAVGHNELQSLQRLRCLGSIHQAGDAVGELIAAVLLDQKQGLPAPVAGDHLIAPVLRGPKEERLLQPVHLDVARQGVQAVDAVKVVFIGIDQIQRDILDLFPRVRSGHVCLGDLTHQGGEVKALFSHCFHLRSAL